MKSDSGITLLELLVAVIIVGTLLSIFGGAFFGGQIFNQQGVAEENLKEFLTVMPDAKSLGCVGRDTDGDGYVSCSAMLPDGRVLPLSCAWGFFNSGCKVTTQRVTPLER